ncbi:hypothetical protein BpHYR1_044286 [Brachionus plicatilis]|uniref:Protein-tyrosine sulfotransferase n=1 Tax=Brachionus plicatilis TaxID=10195 RepID=A0A3M7PDG6_BRAPC|nr:hypothetical protein BpHYR1_044286 [Brachionus plicatilis]
MKSKSKLLIYTAIQIGILYYFNKKYNNEKMVVKRNSVNSSRNFLNKIFVRRMLFVGGGKNSGLEIITTFLNQSNSVKIADYGSTTAIDFKDYVKKIQKKKESFIKNAKLKEENIDKAIGLFTYYILSKNTSDTGYVCSVEERNTLLMEFYKKIFPNSKFIYLVRDGREVAYSQIEGDKTFKKLLGYLEKWNEFNRVALKNCQKVGQTSCLLIRYDQLIANPLYFGEKIMRFLEIDQLANKEIYFESEIYSSSYERIANYDPNLVKKKFQMLSTLNFI